MEYMATVPDKYFDLAVVDVPYGIGENGDRNKSRSKLAKAQDYKAFAGGDVSAPEKTYFDELLRISKNQIVWGANHFISRLPIDSSCWIVWDKENGDSDFADCELAWSSFKSAVRKFKFRWAGMLQENMKNKEVRIHPTQKPVALYEWLLTNYAKKGQRILDTHGGSMSSVIAAINCGCSIVCCELDTDYFAAGVERVRRHQNQFTLFNDENVIVENISNFKQVSML
jgi:site-specific DNA-methyltransferase (adenine-specific)